MNIKQGYFGRFEPLTEYEEVNRLFKLVDSRQLTNEVIKRVGAVPWLRYREYNQKQQLDLYQQIKNALVEIKSNQR